MLSAGHHRPQGEHLGTFVRERRRQAAGILEGLVALRTMFCCARACSSAG